MPRTPPDVVMTLGSAALPFIVEHRDAFAPKAPVVFTSVAPQNYAALRPPPDVTGIITEFDLDKTLALAERLQPDARRLFVIAGSGATDRRWHSVARNVIENRERKFETTYLFGLPYEEIVAALKQVPRDAIVIILTVFADGTGKTFVPAEVAAALAPLSPAPVYAPYDTYLGRRHRRRVHGDVRVGRGRGGRPGSRNPLGQGPGDAAAADKSRPSVQGRLQGHAALGLGRKPPPRRHPSPS